MWKWHCVLLLLNFISASTRNLHLVIVRTDNNNVIPHTLIATPGSNLSLTCKLEGHNHVQNTLTWGRRTEKLWFENVADLEKLAKQGSKQMLNLQNKSDDINRAIVNFEPVKLTDRGTYFCMSLKDMLFKIVRIKLQQAVVCTQYQFKCDNGEKCISKTETCDNVYHCTDHSDEKAELCVQDLCLDGIRCGDDCIPNEWCCDSNTDYNCIIFVRHVCCPPLPVHGVSNNPNADNNYNSNVNGFTHGVPNNPNEDNNYNTNNNRFTPTPAPYSTLFIATAVVLLLMCIVIYFYMKKCSANQRARSAINQFGMPMPSIIRTDDNDNTVILNSRNIANSSEYLDVPPTYDESTRNSPLSSFHSSVEDINKLVINDCTSPPSYEEAVSNHNSRAPSVSNIPDSLSTILEVPSVSVQPPTSADSD